MGKKKTFLRLKTLHGLLHWQQATSENAAIEFSQFSSRNQYRTCIFFDLWFLPFVSALNKIGLQKFAADLCSPLHKTSYASVADIVARSQITSVVQHPQQSEFISAKEIFHIKFLNISFGQSVKSLPSAAPGGRGCTTGRCFLVL